MPRKWTPEARAKFAADMKARREAKAVKVTDNPQTVNEVEPMEKPETVLNVTRENLTSESDLIEHLRRCFDRGETVGTIKINSRQAMAIMDVSSRVYNWDTYNSPFGSHAIVIVPEVELNNEVS